jgi:uncharacterized protein YbjT (DUF2867 family)
MTGPILVTGATGTLGRVVVERLVAAGHEVRGLTRRATPPDQPAGVRWHTGDLATGAGLAGATDGVAAIVHCASDPRHWRTDAPGTRRLIDAATATGAPHLVYVSIVGIDRVPYGYYRAKLDTERVVEAAGLPWTILRATQFHDLVIMVARALAKSPVVPVPAGVSDQPVDVREVAARLVDLATGPAAGRVADMGGPEVRTVKDLFRSYLRATGRRRLLLPVVLPGKAFRAFRAGGHLAPEHADGKVTFDAYLEDRRPD